MNKTCARCEKTVYPTEELKCLDKTWHKGCFKCQECGMTLNMRTYKGYGKLPYCEAHVPKAKHTTMAETPELKRIAENTKLQSNVKYHADFEKSKGKFTQVADDPETLRIKANTRIISNVAYHGDLEKKAQMEKQRQINENGEIVELATNDNYHQQIETYATEMLAPMPPPNLPPKNHYQTPVPQTHRQEYRQEDYYAYPKYEDYPQNANYQSTPQFAQNLGNQKIGKIQDYDPLSDGPRPPPNTQRASATLIYNSSSDGKRGAHHTQQQQQSSRHIGRVTDLDPLANEPPAPHNHHHQNQHSQVKQRVYIAMYDYEANDSDEVSFREGDYISNVTSIDEGWMTGQVLRTGRTGMLPANYVERAPDRH
ncbi:LIM and SH3 domain protein Lasp isoform X1 [Maniola jurtina]|uniref:LIM and SH3 domain protein Lasp isoform X1 n=1 Tax=Maniola jurtina TaxID=191418 RepID=UPI001E68F04B|nr:LIM and SH3 domain protein Lasp isoform X1 [Maniola jurtina]XP_045782851.1 LIM and SH3 domain protein Lasp isoform X1 [Maniola jurtina]